MEHWGPLMTDGLAANREVIFFNGRGAASSTGAPRTRIEESAHSLNRYHALQLSYFMASYRNSSSGKDNDIKNAIDDVGRIVNGEIFFQ